MSELLDALDAILPEDTGSVAGNGNRAGGGGGAKSREGVARLEDHSLAFWDVLRGLYAIGYTREQAQAALGRYGPAVAKYDGRLARKVAEDWARLERKDWRKWVAEAEKAERVKAATEGEPLLGLRPVGDIAAEVDARPPRSWLFGRVWPEDAHGVLAAGWKVGKTWLMLDAVVAVAAGTPWLGLFDCHRTGTVLVFLGEGGDAKMTRRGRAVAAHRGVAWDTLPVVMSPRVPHLSDEVHLDLLRTALEVHGPVLVIIDPLYLAAAGAKGSQLYEMATVLEPVQLAAQAAGSALMVAHHYNRAQGTGSARMSGAGPAEWGRVLVSVERLTLRTDDDTQATDAVLRLDFEGDEIAGGHRLIRRRIHADDADDLTSALHYATEEVADDVAQGGRLSGLAPSRARVLAALEELGDWRRVREVGDRLADDGHPLKARTIQDALKELKGLGLVESYGADDKGTAYSWRVRTGEEGPTDAPF